MRVRHSNKVIIMEIERKIARLQLLLLDHPDHAGHIDELREAEDNLNIHKKLEQEGMNPDPRWY